MGDASTEYGKQRAANGHPAPYQLKTVEIDNETWRMQFSGYLDVVNRFCPAIRARFPNLKLSVVGSYGYDTGEGESNQRDWDPRLIQQAGKLFDILSPHYYNGIYSFTADFVEDPYKYEQFLKSRGEIIRKSETPNIKIYVSEWNLTNDKAPGGETVKNSLDQRDNIKVVPAAATVENHTVKFTMPPLSVGVVRVN
jgi:alpha-L-arabinofuranosidase